MLVMLPATICAGMTLPLITYALFNNGHGEKSIGAVYAANTVGAIIGVFFATHIGMPNLGIKGLLSTGAAIDIGNMGQPMAGLAFDLNGVLYGISGDCALGCGGAAIAETLFTINIDNASLTNFQTLGNGDDGEAIAFNPLDGMMYHLSGVGAGLIFEKINLSTGVVTPISLSGSPVANLEAIGFTFDRARNLFVGSLIDWENCFCDGFFVTLTPGGFLTTVTPLEVGWKDFAFYDVTSDSDIDVTGVTDISGDAVPDVAALSQRSGKRPRVRYFSGADGKKFDQVPVLSRTWSGVAAGTVKDGNQDGVANDPAVVVLGQRMANNRLSVQVLMADGGAVVARYNVLNNKWIPIDVVVIDDANGDGVSNDTAIGVLGFDPTGPSQKQTRLQVIKLSDGSLVNDVYFNNVNWTPLAAAAVHRLGQSPLLAVLAEKNTSKEIRVQDRLLSDGSLQNNKTYLTAAWRGKDLAVLLDGNGDSVLDDPAYMVLAHNPGSGLNKVQVRKISGALIKTLLVLNDQFTGRRLIRSQDIDGGLIEEVGTLGDRNTDGKVRIQLKDFDTEAISGGVNP
jgi:hypothetical protein